MARKGRESIFQIEVIDFRKRNNGHYAPRRPRRTLFFHGKSKERAESWGARFGTVLHCRKVDTTPYRKNIDFLDLHQEPISIEIEREEYVLNKALELSRPRKRYSDKLFDAEPIDNEE